MKLSELSLDHSTQQLSGYPADKGFRFKTFSPFFSSLYENKIVYNERFLCIAKLENIEINPEGFFATATMLTEIELPDWKPQLPEKSWRFGAPWDCISFEKNWFGIYMLPVRFWIDPQLVKDVEQLVMNGDFNEVLRLTYYPE